jgi:hypothetical protein
MRVEGARLVATAIAIAACGTTLREADEPASASTNDADPSFAEESDANVLDDGGDANVVVVDPDGAAPDAGCPNVFAETFTQPHGFPWTASATGGTVTHDVDAGAAAPGALRAAVSPGAQPTFAQISRQTSGLPKSVTLAFAMRVPEITTDYFELGCTLQLKSDDQTFVSFQSEVAGNALQLDSTKKNGGANVSTGSAESIGPVDGSRWYAISIELTGITPAGGKVVVRVDGAPRYDRTVTFPAPPTAVRVKCGVDHGASGGAATVYVDDVVLDSCP